MIKKIIFITALMFATISVNAAQFVCPANGSAVHTVDNTTRKNYQVAVSFRGPNTEILKVYQVFTSNNLVARVIPLAGADYWQGDIVVRPKGGTHNQWNYDIARGNGFEIACTNDTSGNLNVDYTLYEM